MVLMENASRGVADAAGEELQSLIGRPTGEIFILCGGGNNGGDGLAAARHLHNRGAKISIHLTSDPAKYSGDARINWEIIQAMNLPVAPINLSALPGEKPSLIIDAIFGTGLSQAPREPFAEIA